MVQKNDIKVVINNKVYTLSGQEVKIIFRMLPHISMARSPSVNHRKHIEDLMQSIRMCFLR